jgi:predicted nucleic acid-binding protein
MLYANNKIYVDTSAFYALIDRSDRYHEQASILWPKLLNDNITLVTSNYVVPGYIGRAGHLVGE